MFGHGGGHQHWQPVSALPHPADDVRRLREGRFSSDDALVTLCLAPRGNQFATIEVTEQDWALAAELGIRISCHFGDGEWGKGRPIAQLAGRGLLGPTMTFVHCNTLADDELRMMADAGCTASISPDIELQMGHGWPATGRLLDAGIRPSLSIDVCCSNGGHLFGTMRATIGTERGFDNEQARERGEASVEEMELTCRDVLEFATIEGARACGLDGKIGSLTPGKRADVIVVRADTFGMTPLNNPVGAFVYNAHPGLVDTILVDGKVVKRDGKLLGVDAARCGGSRSSRATTSSGVPAGKTAPGSAATGSRRPTRPSRRLAPAMAVTGGADTGRERGTAFYVDLYRRMLLIRGFEELVQTLFLRGEVYGTTHLYSGPGGRRRRLRERARRGRPRRVHLPRPRARARARARAGGAARRAARALDRASTAAARAR